MTPLTAVQGPYQSFAADALAGVVPSRDRCRQILATPADDLLPLLQAAFQVRKEYFGRRVQIHVLENAKLGACPEDCGFCPQSAAHDNPAGVAPMQIVDQLVEGARRAARAQARRYCMATATRGPSSRDLDIICEATRRIKAELNIEVCASLGLLNDAKAQRLAEAGVDRFNHNLETSREFFSRIVSTHTWEDRVRTVETARRAGMTTCCGGIVGMGEQDDDIIELAMSLRELEVDSLPVNLLNPRPGTPLESLTPPDPQHALRVLCLMRFVCPKADIRIAGGREVNLRSMQAFALYPANSIFTSGYLTTGGNQVDQDHQMIRDLGFEIEVVGAEFGAEIAATAIQPAV